MLQVSVSKLHRELDWTQEGKGRAQKASSVSCCRTLAWEKTSGVLGIHDLSGKVVWPTLDRFQAHLDGIVLFFPGL